jgi:hypothetical protein
MGDRAFRSRRVAGVAVLLLLSTAAGPVAAQEVSTPSAATAPQAEVITLGADTEVFRDDFGSAGTWGVSENDAGSVEYADGGLRFTTMSVPNARWSWLDLGSLAPVLWVRAAVEMASNGGAAGAMCLTSGTSPTLLFGIVNTEGEWVVGRTADPEVTVLARGPLPASIDLTQGGRAILSIECAMTDTSGVRVAVWVDGVNVADVNVPDLSGPFSGPGLYGEGHVESFAVTLDDIVVATGATYEPRMRSPQGPPPLPLASPAPTAPAPDSPVPNPSAAASLAPTDELLRHVPIAFAGACAPSDADPANGLMASVLCDPAGEIASAAYFRYDSIEALETAWAAVLADDGPATEGTDCSVGPALVDYTIGDQPGGRLACYLNDGRAVALWTNPGLLMMAIGAEASGDFGKLFTWWQDAGPLP